MKPQPVATQFFENWNGSVTAHAPRPHIDEKTARAHAKELSERRENCEVALMTPEGEMLDSYMNGQAKSAMVAA
jgi:hypothetical protein